MFPTCTPTLGFFQDFSLSLSFCNLKMIWLGVIFLPFILFSILKTSWICDFVSGNNLGKFPVIIVSNFFPLCSFTSGIPFYLNVTPFIFVHCPWVFCSFFYYCFFVSVSVFFVFQCLNILLRHTEAQQVFPQLCSS